MRYLLIFLVLSIIFNACVDPQSELLDTQTQQTIQQENVTTTNTSGSIPRIIFDTDMAEDCDDVGATAVLHALAARGEVKILGMMVSMPVQYGAPALDALNTFYKLPNIPIGTLKNSEDAKGAGNLLVFNKDLALRFPNNLKDARNAPNSVTLYRQLLKNESDRSVVILSVGPLTNLYHLMKSPADNISSLNGMALIRQKVKRIVIAGGKLPEGTSYNFRLAPEKSEYVINNWPTEVWFAPNSLGDNVLTGKEMMSKTTRTNPVHEAYRLYRNAHPTWQFRPSWDQMGVLVAVRGKSGLFKTHGYGGVKAIDSWIRWHASPDKNHLWYQNNTTIEYRRKVVETLMMQAPG
ncbi:MAG: nucleoside hydrolase [Cyclobacteriaceae bacterium]